MHDDLGGEEAAVGKSSDAEGAKGAKFREVKRVRR